MHHHDKTSADCSDLIHGRASQPLEPGNEAWGHGLWNKKLKSLLLHNGGSSLRFCSAVRQPTLTMMDAAMAMKKEVEGFTVAGWRKKLKGLLSNNVK